MKWLRIIWCSKTLNFIWHSRVLASFQPGMLNRSKMVLAKVTVANSRPQIVVILVVSHPVLCLQYPILNLLSTHRGFPWTNVHPWPFHVFRPQAEPRVVLQDPQTSESQKADWRFQHQTWGLWTRMVICTLIIVELDGSFMQHLCNPDVSLQRWSLGSWSKSRPHFSIVFPSFIPQKSPSCSGSFQELALVRPSPSPATPLRTKWPLAWQWRQRLRQRAGRKRCRLWRRSTEAAWRKVRGVRSTRLMKSSGFYTGHRSNWMDVGWYWMILDDIGIWWVLAAPSPTGKCNIIPTVLGPPKIDGSNIKLGFQEGVQYGGREYRVWTTHLLGFD